VQQVRAVGGCAALDERGIDAELGDTRDERVTELAFADSGQHRGTGARRRGGRGGIERVAGKSKPDRRARGQRLMAVQLDKDFPDEHHIKPARHWCAFIVGAVSRLASAAGSLGRPEPMPTASAPALR
jgi:hypothetical protein